MSVASPRISIIGASSAIAAGRGTICCRFSKRPRIGRARPTNFTARGGPLLTSRTADKPLLCRTMIEAGTEIGLEYHEDVNHLPPGAGDNIGWVQQTRRGRRRQSAARTYLRPAKKRANLT